MRKNGRDGRKKMGGKRGIGRAGKQKMRKVEKLEKRGCGGRGQADV